LETSLKKHLSTLEDLKEFEKWCRYYLNKYKLNSYYSFFERADTDHSDGTVCINLDSMTITFSLNTKIYSSKESLKLLAKHEVCHVVTAEVTELAYKRYVTRDQLEQGCETVTNRLTSLLED